MIPGRDHLLGHARSKLATSPPSPAWRATSGARSCRSTWSARTISGSSWRWSRPSLSLWDWDIPASRVHYDEAFAQTARLQARRAPRGPPRPGKRCCIPKTRRAVSRAHRRAPARPRAARASSSSARARSDGEWMWLGARGRVVARGRAGGAAAHDGDLSGDLGAQARSSRSARCCPPSSTPPMTSSSAARSTASSCPGTAALSAASATPRKR